MHLTNKDKLLIGISFLGILLISLLGWVLWGEVILIAMLGGIFAALATIQISTYRRSLLMTHQIEALFSMFSLLKIRKPLTRRDAYAILPDFANILISTIYEKKPALILEAGSGFSTLVAAYCLENLGGGRIVSLEHLELYATSTTNDVAKHELQNVVTIVHAPLKEIPLGGKTWLWYDVTCLEGIEKIDLLIVDGPPGSTQKMARYPALPILFERLSDNAIILLDDAAREGEKKIVDMWLREFDGLECERVDTEMGAIVLRKKTPDMSG